MNARYILFFFLISVSSIYSQPASFYFNIYSQDRKQFTDDAIYFLSDNFELNKCSYSGDTLWSKSIPGLWNWSVGENALYILTGADILSKVDTSGNITWSKDISAVLCGQSGALRAVTSFTDRIFLYWKYSPTCDALLVLDTGGSFVNAWCDYSNLIDYETVMLFPDPVGDVWIELIDGPGNGNYAVLAKLDHNGNPDTLAALQRFNICLDDFIEDILPFSDSTILVIDNGNDFILPWLSNCGLFKLDRNGNILHQKIFGATGDTSFQIARAGMDTLDNIYLVLSYIENNSGYISLKLDSELNVLDTKIWNSNFGNPMIMDHYDQMKYHQGKFYCPATYYVSSTVSQQSFLILDTLLSPICGMTMLPTGVSVKNYQSTMVQWNPVSPAVLVPVPSNYSLTAGTLSGKLDLCLSISTPEIRIQEKLTVTPNPASAWILFDIEEESRGSIRIVDITGKAILDLDNISTDQRIDISFLPAGIYILNYVNASYSAIRKIIKI